MKKILFLIPMLLIITGCSVTDNITITKDLTVEEKINMAESSEFFASRYKELPITVIKSILDTGNRKNTLIENGYSYEIVENNAYPSVDATKKYNSLEEFANSSIFNKQLYKNITVTENNGLITLHASDIIFQDEFDQEIYTFDICSISITLPYVVEDNNANTFYKKTNTYTWNFKKDEIRDITLTFNKNKIYVYDLARYISYLILVLVIIAIIVIIVKMYKKNKFNNQISS